MSPTAAAPAAARDRTNVVRQAIGTMPSAIQGEALEIAYLSAAGYGIVEVGARLGLTWREADRTRAAVASHLIVALRADGYADAEIARTFGVPSALMADGRAAATASGGSGSV